MKEGNHWEIFNRKGKVHTRSSSNKQFSISRTNYTGTQKRQKE